MINSISNKHQARCAIKEAKPNSQDIKWTLRDVFIVFFSSYSLLLIICILFLRNVQENLYIATFIHNILILIVIYVLLRVRSARLENLGFNRAIAKKGLIHGILIGSILYFAMNICFYPLTSLDIILTKLDYKLIILYLIIPFTFDGFNGVLFNPFVEEILYRGLLYQALRKKYGLIPAILTSSIIFGIFHFMQGYKGIITAFILGLSLAYLFYRTRNLVLVISAHATINCHALAFQFIINSQFWHK